MSQHQALAQKSNVTSIQRVYVYSPPFSAGAVSSYPPSAPPSTSPPAVPRPFVAAAATTSTATFLPTSRLSAVVPAVSGTAGSLPHVPAPSSVSTRGRNVAVGSRLVCRSVGSWTEYLANYPVLSLVGCDCAYTGKKWEVLRLRETGMARGKCFALFRGRP